jgi:hypothetical protein
MTATATHIEHEIGGEGLFVLRLRDGAARLRGVDGDTVRVSAAEDLEESFRVERGNGSLSLNAARTVEIHIGPVRLSPELDVDVPRRATVVVEAASAAVSSDGLRGDQRYQTVSGDISLTSVAGAVVVEAVSGDVRLVARGALDLQARTVSGDLEVRAGRIDHLAAGTTSGDVRVAGELATGGKHRIETVSGDMLLALAGGVRLVATTVAGDVRSMLPHRSEGGRGQRVLIVGDGAATLETRSMSGNVQLVEARYMDRTAHPAPPVPPAPPAPPAAPTALAQGEQPSPSTLAIAAAYDEERLRILRSLERGEIDVSEAGTRLARLDGEDQQEADR